MSGATAPRTLDLATFTAPAGWHVETRGEGPTAQVVMSKTGPATYCMVVVSASGAAAQDLGSSFAAEWTRVALQTLDPVATPRPALSPIGDLWVATGAATSTHRGQPIMGLLAVADADSRVVPILVLAPSFAALEPYRTEVDAVLASLTVRRVAASPAVPPEHAGDASAPARSVGLADLAGEWGLNDGINTTYVDRHTGTYAGTDSIHFTEKWLIGANGTISLDFYGIHNGRRIVEKSEGALALSSAGILTVRMSNEQLYVLRGWDERPDMTVMTLNGPWYGSIPPEILANPAQGANLDQRWVRLRRS